MMLTQITRSPEQMAAGYPRLAGAGQPPLTSPMAQGQGTAGTHSRTSSPRACKHKQGHSRGHRRQHRAPPAWQAGLCPGETEAQGSRSGTAKVMQEVGGREVPVPRLLRVRPKLGAEAPRHSRAQCPQPGVAMPPYSHWASLWPPSQQDSAQPHPPQPPPTPFSRPWLSPDAGQPPAERHRQGADTCRAHGARVCPRTGTRGSQAAPCRRAQAPPAWHRFARQKQSFAVSPGGDPSFLGPKQVLR